MDQELEWSKLAVNIHIRHLETTLEVCFVLVQECIKDGLWFPILQLGHSCETELATERDQEWNLINKEDIHRNGNVLVELQQFLGNFDKVPSHRAVLLLVVFPFSPAMLGP